ncbi:FomB family phosphonate monophosphate kinase [Streptomyces sp. NPDC020965]|uniref:FomB family phosphonate monophosphate kinase n=1 Tax=Streptomyces sp. NPDC020965 TaxID=3365105 RepID=UPI0037ACF115
MMENLTIRSSRLVNLNLLRVRVSSNRENFSAYSYFSSFCANQSLPADYEVICIDLDRDDVPESVYAEKVDRTFRSKRFKAGYYLVHYFGEPAHLVTVGQTFYVFGRALEKTVWPYFVKHILTIFAADQGFLHLKAAAFELPGAGATLLIGRNGAGKTVFLAQACLSGAQFISNTHALVRDGVVHGVPSSIRIRRDRCFGELIDRHRLTPHMESGDYVTDASTLFDSPPTDSAPVRNVVIVDYNPASLQGLNRISSRAAETFMDQFSFAVTTYGLKDDLLAHHGSDFDSYVDSLARMRKHLTDLVEDARCYRVNADMLDSDSRYAVLKQLTE